MKRSIRASVVAVAAAGFLVTWIALVLGAGGLTLGGLVVARTRRA